MVKPEPASAGWPWANSLDAMVAAPKFHALLLEDERVRVLDVRIAPGEVVPVHTHRWPSVQCVLSGQNFIRRDAEGRVLLDTRAEPPMPVLPAAMWSGPLPPHSVENLGTAEIHVISIEFKDDSA